VGFDADGGTVRMDTVSRSKYVYIEYYGGVKHQFPDEKNASHLLIRLDKERR
jgi:hypothetical protein